MTELLQGTDSGGVQLNDAKDEREKLNKNYRVEDVIDVDNKGWKQPT